MTSSNDQEEEFPGDDLEILSSLRSRDSRRNRIRNLKRFDLEDNSDDEDSDNMLSGASNYTISLKQQSLAEMEQEEEMELCKAIRDINIEYKMQSKHERSSSGSDFDNSSEEENEDNIANTEFDLSPMYNKGKKGNVTEKNSNGSENSFHSSNTLSTFSNTYLQEDKEIFISQNLIVYDELLKLIVIGNKSVGKSTFIKKLINEESNGPTMALEINKTIVNVNNKKVKLEFFDTNTQIINSSIIKTYYKISQGYIAIIDSYQNVDNLLWLKKQIEEIHSAKTFHAKLFLIVNEYTDTTKKSNKEQIKDFIDELTQKYIVQVKKCDLSKTDFISDEDFMIYIKDILYTKKCMAFCANRNSSQLPMNNNSTSDNIRRGSDNTIFTYANALRTSPQGNRIKNGTLYLSPKEKKNYKKILI